MRKRKRKRRLSNKQGPGSQPPLGRRLGFTLLEMVIVLAIIATLCTAFFSYQQFAAATQLQTAAHQIAGLLSRAQMRARVHGAPQTLTWRDRSLTATTPSGETRTYTLPGMVIPGAPEGALGPPGSPSRPIIATCSWPRSQRDARALTLHPDGPASPGTLYLCNRSRTHGYALTTTPDAVSGIRVYEWHEGKWK